MLFLGDKMPAQSRANLFVGLFFVVIALFTIFVWIPLDIETGLIEKARGRFVIGDALAPTIACAFLVIGGLLLVLFERKKPEQEIISRSQMSFITRIVCMIILGVIIMRYTGPILAELVNIFRAEPIEYRLLRATPGWKHVGYISGGISLIAGVIAIVEGKLTRRALITALIAVLAMIAVFDVPFDDLLLPPNGDV